MIKIKCCLNCKDREVGCHGKCERYQEERRLADEDRDMRYKDRLQRTNHIYWKRKDVGQWR